jgi:hypothetical protein
VHALQELSTAAVCTKQLATDGQPFTPMLQSLAAEVLQRLRARGEQPAPMRLNGHHLAEILSTFSHFRYHPGDALLQAASATLRIHLPDMRLPVGSLYQPTDTAMCRGAVLMALSS